MSEQKRRGRPPKVEPTDDKALDLAQRVWAGQSSSLARGERLARVRRALEAQSLSADGIDFEAFQ